MGVPEIKYGDSVCFVQHIASGLWVTYKAQDAKTPRLGPLKRKVRGWKGFSELFYTELEELGKRTYCKNQVDMISV